MKRKRNGVNRGSSRQSLIAERTVVDVRGVQVLEEEGDGSEDDNRVVEFFHERLLFGRHPGRVPFLRETREKEEGVSDNPSGETPLQWRSGREDRGRTVKNVSKLEERQGESVVSLRMRRTILAWEGLSREMDEVERSDLNRGSPAITRASRAKTHLRIPQG